MWFMSSNSHHSLFPPLSIDFSFTFKYLHIKSRHFSFSFVHKNITYFCLCSSSPSDSFSLDDLRESCCCDCNNLWCCRSMHVDNLWAADCEMTAAGASVVDRMASYYGAVDWEVVVIGGCDSGGEHKGTVSFDGNRRECFRTGSMSRCWVWAVCDN